MLSRVPFWSPAFDSLHPLMLLLRLYKGVGLPVVCALFSY